MKADVFGQLWARIRRGRRSVLEDVAAVLERDPAARSAAEVVLCYPGLHALCLHRLSHTLYLRRWFLVARVLSHVGRTITGVEIHPGATIGRRVVIDHGMGVVIGETAVIGDDVLLYQGVTLGGTSLEKKKRHPTLGSRIVVGVGATILGNIEVGDDARVGAGAVVMRPVERGSTVVGVPAHPVHLQRPAPTPMPNLDHVNLPDPVAEAVSVLLARIQRLETELHVLHGKNHTHDRAKRQNHEDAASVLARSTDRG
ncbi:MAG: serine O-acetyltransferase [Chloroflexota bacterium]|nr:MAG: serine O-acetyltransferase [Chloroflexota bacterium]